MNKGMSRPSRCSPFQFAYHPPSGEDLLDDTSSHQHSLCSVASQSETQSCSGCYACCVSRVPCLQSPVSPSSQGSLRAEAVSTQPLCGLLLSVLPRLGPLGIKLSGDSELGALQPSVPGLLLSKVKPHPFRWGNNPCCLLEVPVP